MNDRLPAAPTDGDTTEPGAGPNDLVIERVLRAPRAAVWRAWSDPELLKQWWCPKPWTTEVLAFDFRAGGAFHTFMRSPDGGESDNPSCFLEVVPQERIVCTSLMTAGYRPSKPWLPMSVVITLADEGDDTRYSAIVMHLDKAGRDQHEQMGFEQGWGAALKQLEAVAQGLA